MKHTYLHDVLPFLRELEREKQKQFEAYFRTAPLWLMDLFQSEDNGSRNYFYQGK